MSVLQQLHEADWLALVSPQMPRSCNCICQTCLGVELLDAYDVCHEVLQLFTLMQQLPPYPRPLLEGYMRGGKPCRTSVTSTCNSPGPEETMDFSLRPCDSIYSRRVNSIIPQSQAYVEQAWVEMLALHSQEELWTLQNMFEVVLKKFFLHSGSKSANHTPWLNANSPLTRTLVDMMRRCLGSFAANQTHLALERLPAVSRTRVENPSRFPGFSDLRLAACDLLKRLWQAIDPPRRSHYLSMFIPTFVDMATIPIYAIRKSCVELILDALTVSPIAVENLLVCEIDRVMQWADDEFADELLRLLAADTADVKGIIGTSRLRSTLRVARGGVLDGRWLPRGEANIDSRKAAASAVALSAASAKNPDHHRQQFINLIVRQLNCLREYGIYSSHPSRLNGMLAINNLRDFYKSISRLDMTRRYLFRLERLHKTCKNFTEQGYTLQEISEQYRWSDEPQDADEVSPQYAQHIETSSALKGRLLEDSLQCLDFGKDWERAIEVCQQLLKYYRSETANFSSVSKILEKEASLYAKIVGDDPRLPYHYYLLHFVGKGFPSFITSSLIYRTTDMRADVVQTITQQFPFATIANTEPNEQDQANWYGAPTIYVIGNLQPVPKLPPHLAALPDLDPRIREYYDNHHVNVFVRQRFFDTSKSSETNPSAGEKTQYTTCDTFPNILPVIPVTHTEKCLLSQYERSVYFIECRITQLSMQLDKLNRSARPQDTLSEFVMGLCTSIRSPVSGGITNLLETTELMEDEQAEQKLAEVCLALLEVQYKGLRKWYELVSPSVTSTSPTSDDNCQLRVTMRDFAGQAHDISRKFGFSVDHLNVKALSTPSSSSTSLPSNDVSASAIFSSTKRICSGYDGLLRSSTMAQVRKTSAQPSIRVTSGTFRDTFDQDQFSPFSDHSVATEEAFDAPPPMVPQRPNLPIIDNHLDLDLDLSGSGERTSLECVDFASPVPVFSASRAHSGRLLVNKPLPQLPTEASTATSSVLLYDETRPPPLPERHGRRSIMSTQSDASDRT